LLGDRQDTFGRHGRIETRVGEVEQRPPPKRATSLGRPLRPRGEQPIDVVRAGGRRSCPDVRRGQIGMLSDQPPGLGPARRPVLAAVRQAGEAAELIRGIGHRNRTEPGFPTVFGHRCEVSPEPRPTREPVLAGDDQPRGRKRQAGELVGSPTGIVMGQPRQRAGVAGPDGALEQAGLTAEAVEVGAFRHVQSRHDDLLSSA
jgi:hypothetical protein